MLGLLRRTFTTNSIRAKKLLYLSLVHSKLVYCSPIWRQQCLEISTPWSENNDVQLIIYVLSDYSSNYRDRLMSLKNFTFNDVVGVARHPLFLSGLTIIFELKNLYHSLPIVPDLVGMLNLHKFGGYFYFQRLPHPWNALPVIDLTKINHLNDFSPPQEFFLESPSL